MAPSERKFIIDLVYSGLVGETKRVELAALSLARILKKDDPEIAKGIQEAIGRFALAGTSNLRSMGESPIPIDQDSQLEMASILQPDLENNPFPILPSGIKERVGAFLEERQNIELLLAKNIKPSTSILLLGQPGTGKTMLAKHIASALNKNLVILDLSSSMSSLLGKTGANLKRVIQYAKQNASVLLFDEFDAIAKKRDDSTDLGEIKRVVNILLMELEDWPVSSVFIATSNYPELLDKAIWRRFDHSITIPVPEQSERVAILQNAMEDFVDGDSGDVMRILEPIAELFEGKSPADLCRYINNVKRRSVLKSENPVVSLFEELEDVKDDKKIRGKFCVIAKKVLGDSITIRELADITGLSPAGVQHHLKSKI